MHNVAFQLPSFLSVTLSLAPLLGGGGDGVRDDGGGPFVAAEPHRRRLRGTDNGRGGRILQGRVVSRASNE